MGQKHIAKNMDINHDNAPIQTTISNNKYKIYTCSVCLKEFDKKDNFHIHSQRKNKCVRRLPNQVPISDKIKQIKCQHCKKILSRKDSLNRHEKKCTSKTINAIQKTPIPEAYIEQKGEKDITEVSHKEETNKYQNLINFDINFSDIIDQKILSYSDDLSYYIKENPQLHSYKIIVHLLHLVNLNEVNINYNNVYISDNKKNMTAHVFNYPRFEKRNNNDVVNQILLTYAIYVKHMIEKISQRPLLNYNFKKICHDIISDIDEVISGSNTKYLMLSINEIREQLFAQNEYGRIANTYIKNNPFPKQINIDFVENQLKDKAIKDFYKHRHYYDENCTLEDYLDVEYYPYMKKRECIKECKINIDKLFFEQRINQSDVDKLLHKLDSLDNTELFLFNWFLSRTVVLYETVCDFKSLIYEFHRELNTYNYLLGK